MPAMLQNLGQHMQFGGRIIDNQNLSHVSRVISSA
jgi:hypothetical protein